MCGIFCCRKFYPQWFYPQPAWCAGDILSAVVEFTHWNVRLFQWLNHFSIQSFQYFTLRGIISKYKSMTLLYIYILLCIRYNYLWPVELSLLNSELIEWKFKVRLRHQKLSYHYYYSCTASTRLHTLFHWLYSFSIKVQIVEGGINFC